MKTLHNEIYEAEYTKNPSMSGRLWLERAALRLTALLDMHRLNVPDHALANLADLAHPEAVQMLVQRGLIIDGEVAWLKTLPGIAYLRRT